MDGSRRVPGGQGPGRPDREDGTRAAGNRGRVVKLAGDEVLFVTDRPADAAEIALRLTGPDRTGRALPACALARPPAGRWPDSAVCTGPWPTGPRADVAGQAGYRRRVRSSPRRCAGRQIPAAAPGRPRPRGCEHRQPWALRLRR